MMNEQQIRNIVKDEIYKSNNASRFNGVTAISDHIHNGVDSPKIPSSSVKGFEPMPSTVGGVFSNAVLAGQIINNLNNQVSGTLTTLYAYPINIIYGFGGSGPASQFNGGDAPLGSAVVFANSSSLSQELWIRMDVDGYTDKWWGVSLNLTV